MATVSTYLNFTRNTEEAFTFYRSVFGNDFDEPGINRLGEVPGYAGQPEMAEEDKNLVMHVSLETIGGHKLHGTDSPESMGFTVNQGNNVSIMLEPDSREEADKLFGSLASGGEVAMPLQEMFWGAYWGSLVDKFGIHWMFSVWNSAAQ